MDVDDNEKGQSLDEYEDKYEDENKGENVG